MTAPHAVMLQAGSNVCVCGEVESNPVHLTAPSLRDRIARAIERSDDEPYDEPEDVYLLNADAVMAVLADADPTDLGMEQVGWQLPEGGFHDDEWVPHFEHHLCTPVYARPRTEETTDG